MLGHCQFPVYPRTGHHDSLSGLGFQDHTRRAQRLKPDVAVSTTTRSPSAGRLQDFDCRDTYYHIQDIRLVVKILKC